MFGGYRHCCGRDIMPLLVEGQVSTCHYCLLLKYMAWKHIAYHINKSDPGHTLSV